MKTYASQALSKYDGYWLASYTKNEPSIAHVLWQYTDRHYSSALHKKVDASKLREQKSWFLGTVSKQVTNNDVSKGQKVGNRNGNTEIKPTAVSKKKTAKVISLAAKKSSSKKIKHHKKKYAKKSVKKHHKKKHVKKVHHKKKHHKKKHVKKIHHKKTRS